MTLKAQVMADMKTAMKAKDKAKVGTLRMFTAAIKQVEVDERKELSEQEILSIVGKMIKQRKDAAVQYKDAGREDLETIELAEIAVLEDYLPEQLSQDAINDIVQAIINESGANGMQDMGKVMGLAKAQIAGQADMGVVSQTVKSLLS
ncbi:GatB/YqeY domain-containing protein [Marinicella rhabdoformis]|uniref:GatB/YqeY domain-containing protein n=1 Tax=Marinicella rhabdoformis TaxID=2580566 RepID=UPI0012AEBC30|nr:GatB/YqeY domain-containing protein [Marinicella rhabdoformis]